MGIISLIRHTLRRQLLTGVHNPWGVMDGWMDGVATRRRQISISNRTTSHDSSASGSINKIHYDKAFIAKIIPEVDITS